jgi:hypothetical protein
VRRIRVTVGQLQVGEFGQTRGLAKAVADLSVHAQCLAKRVSTLLRAPLAQVDPSFLSQGVGHAESEIQVLVLPGGEAQCLLALAEPADPAQRGAVLVMDVALAQFVADVLVEVRGDPEARGSRNIVGLSGRDRSQMQLAISSVLGVIGGPWWRAMSD